MVSYLESSLLFGEKAYRKLTLFQYGYLQLFVDAFPSNRMRVV